MKTLKKKDLDDLILGISGIFVAYLLAGFLHEWMIKIPYQNQKQIRENFNSPIGILVFVSGITWIITTTINYFKISKQQKTVIPQKNSALCASMVLISTLTYTYAIYMTSFPVVMMIKCLSVISAQLVGIFLYKFKVKKTKFSQDKLIFCFLLISGVSIFNWLDPQTQLRNDSFTQVFAMILLFISLLADGLLPDFQAEIKVKYKPLAMQVMAQTNKWIFILSTIYSIIIGQTFYTLNFIANHHLFGFHIILLSILSTFGQIFVYRIIKNFKENMVSFVIASRKIITIGISIIYYGHQTNFWQIFSIFIVFSAISCQFLRKLSKFKIKPSDKNTSSKSNNKIFKQSKQQQIKLVSKQSPSIQDISIKAQIQQYDLDQNQQLQIQPNSTFNNQPTVQ